MAGVEVMERRSSDWVDEDIIVGHYDDGRPGLRSAISRRTGLMLGLLGVLAAVASILALRAAHSSPPPPPSAVRSVAWTLADASTVRTSGPAQLVVQTITYAPGQTSGWHSHPGLHLVTVISGTLTVYGPDCQPRRYGPAEPYIGGDTAHLARNDGEVPVEMGVTYLTTPGQSMAGFRQAHQAPTSCPVQ